jgi:cytochrome c oxidase subunit III
MNAISTTLRPAKLEWELPERGRVAMFALIAAEAAIFSIFVVAYLFYIGKSLSGPIPAEVLSPPFLYTVCLLSSSLTIHFAAKRIRSGKVRSFGAWWLLTITTNLFGTTYYSLVGLHGFHVVVGLLGLTTVMVFTLFGTVKQEHAERIDVLSLYWHFVDAVWIVVFTVVYIIGR